MVLALLVPVHLQAKKLFRKAAKKYFKQYLAEICDWIESAPIEGPDSTGLASGGSVRALLAGYELAGKEQRFLDAALRWGDRLIERQQHLETSRGNPAALWLNEADGLPLNLADSSLAAAALARSYAHAGKDRKRTFREALERYARVLVEGHEKDPSKKGWEGSQGWVITGGDEKGAIGMGYVDGQVALKPSTASTAAGSLFFAQLYRVTQKPLYRRLATDGIRWLIKSRRPNGQIPAIVDGNISLGASLQVIPYCSEAFQAAYYLLADPDLTRWMLAELDLTIRWLLRIRNKRGIWGEGPEETVTTGITTLLAWYYLNADTDESIPSNLNPPWELWLNPVHAQSFGVLVDEPTTGLVGMTAAEMIKPGITFRKK